MTRPAFAFAFSLFVLASFGASAVSAQTILKLAHLNPQRPFDIPSAAMASVFKQEVEKYSHGTIQVEIYADGSLGNEIETMTQVKSGIVHSFITTTGGLAPYYPLIDITAMPFAFQSYEVAYRVYDGSFGRELAADIEKKAGFKVLGFGESGGFFAITNSRRQIRNPGDLKGLKIRTMSLPLHQNIVRSLGALPVTVAWAEVYAALQTGVADGQMNPVSIISMAKFQEVQGYITLLDLLYSPYIWIMNPKFYAGLTPGERRIVDEAAQTAIIAGRGMSRLIDASDKGLSALSSRMRVFVPGASELKQFRDATIPAAREFIGRQYKNEGETLLERFYAAIAKAERETDD
ncbi:MAG: DctP family TRAP transporter solute-binding subunit [Rectinemataceae bacterium]